MSLDAGNIDLADILEDSMKVVSQAAAERNISLARHGPQHLVLEADRRALKQVFLNLLSNAVKFTRDGGSVDVHLSRSRGHVKIAIKDTGIGIPEVRHRQARPPLRAGRKPILQEPSGQRSRPCHLPRFDRTAWRRLADHQPRRSGHDRHLHPAGAPGARRGMRPSSPPAPSFPKTSSHDALKSLVHGRQAYPSAWPRAWRSPACPRRAASKSFSARGASSATNGLSRQSLSSWVSV